MLQTTGLELVITGETHKAIRSGENCQGTLIDHVYTNVKHKLTDIKKQEQSGSHHKLLSMTLRSSVKFQGPKEIRTRVRKRYTKEGFLTELDRRDWTLEQKSGKNRVEQIGLLERTVKKLVNNVKDSLRNLAPIKLINMRAEEEPWVEDHDVVKMKEKERVLWKSWKEEPMNTSAKEEWDKTSKELKKICENKKSLKI